MFKSGCSKLILSLVVFLLAVLFVSLVLLKQHSR